MPGCAARKLRTRVGAARSPPMDSHFIPANAPTSVVTSMLNSWVVMNAAFTPSSAISARRVRGTSTVSSSSTVRPPVSSMLQQSRVKPSQVGGAVCGITVPGPNSA